MKPAKNIPALRNNISPNQLSEMLSCEPSSNINNAPNKTEPANIGKGSK